MEETGAPFPFELRLFGQAEARVFGRPIPHLRARAGLHLLALLTLRPRQPMERSWLAATLWPDSSGAQALYNLRRNLVDVRRGLGVQAYRVESPTPRTLRLELTDAFCDVQVFDAALRQIPVTSKERLEEVVELYRGPLLEGCEEEWVYAERQERLQGWLAALERLADGAIREGSLAEASRRLRQIVTADPYRETAQRALMEILAAMGDPAAATLAYREFRHLLLRELHCQPSPETQAAYHGLRTRASPVTARPSPRRNLPGVDDILEPSNRTARLVASAPDGPASHRLPIPLDSLVGRIGERREVRGALQTFRLVTLTGTGGVGKTRLALAVAEEAGGDFPDGVWFADLAPIQDGKAVSQAVAAAMGLRQETDVAPKEALCDFVRQKRLLLILDNCEQIADACARLAVYLLHACPLLRILCTSRQPLYVPGENVRAVSPLNIPPVPTATDSAEQFAENLANYESASLLLDRAMRASPAFRLTPRNAPAIARLCRQLDGLPLALELVAARFRSLSAAEIASRLERRLQLPASGDPTQPRHRTLQAALDWSYDLLDKTERRLLRCLTVFAGGWTLEAAEAVSVDIGWPEIARSEDRLHPEGTHNPVAVGRPGYPASSGCESIQDHEVLDLLTSLVDKSLVVYEEQDDRGRYCLLETTREYASERLLPEERQSVQALHAEYFVHMALAMEQTVTDEAQKWLDRLWVERDNFRAAHAWYQEENADTALWLEFLLIATRTWPVQNARQWIERLQLQPMPPTAVGVRISYSVASWALWLGDPASERLLKQALDVARARGENVWQMRVFALLAALEEERGNNRQAFEYAEATLVCAKEGGDLGQVAEFSAIAATRLWRLGEVETARHRLQTLLQDGRRSGDWRSLYFPLWALGEIALAERKPAEARAYCEEALSLAERYYRGVLVNLWRNLGWVACIQQDYSDSWRCFNQALAISQQTHAYDREGWTLFDMAEVAFLQGDAQKAREHLGESLSLFESLHEPRSMAQCLQKSARFCAAWRQTERAATLLASAERAFREQEFTTSSEERDAAMNLAADLRAMLEPEAWQTAWQYGEGMTLGQATAYAFAGLALSPDGK